MRVTPLPRIMPSVLVTFDVPDEVRESVEAHVMSNLDVLPNWIVQLHVIFDKEISIAEIRPLSEYRRALLSFGPGWLEATVSYRRRTIVHEFMHVQLAPLHRYAARVIDIAGKGNDALDLELREQLRIALEQTTSDLEALTVRLLDRGDGTDQEAAATSTLPQEHGMPRL
jgi:hypothetical protein